MTLAVEQSAELSGAFFLILVIMAMSFLAGFGLCFILLHRRRGGFVAAPERARPPDEPPGYGAADAAR